MIVEFRQSFIQDWKRIRARQLVDRIKEAIEQLEKADSLTDLVALSRYKGTSIISVFAWEIIGWVYF